MTEEEENLAFTAINTAYSQQIVKIFGVFCSAPEDEISSGVALSRFNNGMDRATSVRVSALAAIGIVNEPE